jgi:hypothetical protein
MIFRSQHGVPYPVDCDLLAHGQLQIPRCWTHVNKIAVVENHAIDFAVSCVVERLDRAFFVDELPVFGIGEFDLSALLAGE